MSGDLHSDQRPSMHAVHLAVRNILFNELGFSRKGVEDLVKEEIGGVSAKHFSKESIQSWILNSISKAIYGRYRGSQLHQMIEDEVKKQVSAHVKKEVDEYLKDRLTVDIKAKL